MKIKITIILILASITVNAQSWSAFNAFGLQRKIVGSDTTWRFVGSGTNGFRTFNPYGGGGTADSTVFRTKNNSYSLAGMQTKLNKYVLSTRNFSSGFGLLGGGTLASDRVIYADTTVLRSWSNSLSLAQLQTKFNTKQNTLTLTTAGSGNATLIGDVLNIPNNSVTGGIPVVGAQSYGFTSGDSPYKDFTVNIGSTQANTNYKILITMKDLSTTLANPLVSKVVNTSTTQFTVSIIDLAFASSATTYTGTFNWVLLPSDWTGGGSGGGSYTLPIATSSILGGVKVGTGLTINSSTGVLDATGGGSYTLPIATGSVLGGVKVGSGLSIDAGTGVLSSTSSGGSVTNVSSANSDISVASSTTTPVLTLNSGLAASQIVKRDVGAFIPITSGSRIGSIASNDIALQAATFNMYKYTSGSISGHFFNSTTGSTYDDFTFFPQNSTFPGRIVLGNLKSTDTPPTPVGTPRMLIVDNNGTVSSQSIPGGGGGGTVTSVAMSVPTGLTVSGSPITSTGTLAVSLQSGYSIPTTANQSTWSGKQDAITLTTTGTSGAATFSSGVLNIPQYSGGSGGWTESSGTLAPTNSSLFVSIPKSYLNVGNIEDGQMTFNSGDLFGDGLIGFRGQAQAIRTATSSTTLNKYDYTVACNGTFTVTLPSATGNLGQIFVIKNIGTGAITIATTSSQNIDGGTSATINMQWSSITVQSNGTQYFVL